MLKVTELGEQTITFLLLSFIYWCVDKRTGVLLSFNVSIGCTWNQFIKWKCRIDRPWVRDERIVPVQEALAGAGGYSFPSGHTSRAAAIWGALGASLWKDKKRALSAICWIILAIIAFSRNYLGVHTPQDVIAAFIMGLVLILLLEKVLCWVERGQNRDLLAAGAGCLLCFCPMLWAGCLSNAGAGMGFFIGWVLERRFVRFETEGTRTQKCVRFAMGGAGIVFILTVLPAVLRMAVGSKYAGFFVSFTLAMFIIVVYPFFFSKKARYKAGVGLLVILIAGIVIFSAWKTHEQKKAEQEAQVMEQREIQSAEGQIQEAEPTGQEAQGEKLLAVIAHRGYSSLFPENTLASFAGAMDIGADYIELDVQLTKDGQAVVFHDDDLKRITGAEGAVSDYTLEELSAFDAGSWFSSSFAGTRIPTLKEALEMISTSDCKVYLELKDIGEAAGFEETILEAVLQCNMKDRCVFASFQYRYLAHFKELDADLQTLYNTTSGKTTLPEEFPADYYGLYTESVTPDTIHAIHAAGKKAFVWTVNTPTGMQNVQDMGADGIVTNYPGMAKVMRQPEYSYLIENFESAIPMPGLYGADIPAGCEDMVVQGLTQAGNRLIVSAYSYSGEQNSILYLISLSGELQKIVDLGFKAHTGGIAYDEAHDLLWVTGPEGKVYAVSWSAVLSGTYQGEIQVSFDAGLVNHNGTKVASFLTLAEGELFVGSYVNGAEGVLNRYDLSDVQNPKLASAVAIPERIQGITFKRDVGTGEQYMFLSQSYQTEDSHLLKFLYDDQISVYTEPTEAYLLPEGSEQIQATARGMYILFESAARPYRETARIPNDQIYLIR
ncbi:MAG: phosphatase PAP2 family protein [Lachnospiraceae bacterium]|nr:phosphatase PAP2 family protein [Lachnospiraceae bacterium]